MTRPASTNPSTLQGSWRQLAAEMLHWLLRDAERVRGFAAATGYTPQAMMQDIDDALPLAVFEYLMSDEPLLLQFCADTGTRPEECARHWQALQHG